MAPYQQKSVLLVREHLQLLATLISRLLAGLSTFYHLIDNNGCCGFTGPVPPPLLMSHIQFTYELYNKYYSMARVLL